MTMTNELVFEPDYAVPPGEILEETLSAIGMKKRDFSIRCGLSVKTVSQILAGKAPISAETAVQFEKVIDVSADVWNNLESAYRLFLAREKDHQQMAQQTEWVRNFPLTDLRKLGVVSEPRVTGKTVAEVLDFLRLASIDAWDNYLEELQLAAKRAHTFKSSPFAVACWLRLAEKQVDDLHCDRFDGKLFRKKLSSLVELSKDNPSKVRSIIVDECSKAGVAVAFVGELDKTHIAGGTRWLEKDKALIVLSLRHKTDDHFWFSFLHEAGHILLHGKREFFLDEANGTLDKQEREANDFAANFLIAPKAWRQFVRLNNFNKLSIKQFAAELGISPGIIVGRLQKEELLSWKFHNDLKKRIEL